MLWENTKLDYTMVESVQHENKVYLFSKCFPFYVCCKSRVETTFETRKRSLNGREVNDISYLTFNINLSESMNLGCETFKGFSVESIAKVFSDICQCCKFNFEILYSTRVDRF